MSQSPVIVVGAGPVGLSVAATLADQGVDVQVFESRNDVDREPRASTFHAPTLELLEPLGVVESMIERGLIADRYQHRDRERGIVAEFDFRLLAEDTRYPFRLQCEQHKLCDLLLARLEDAEHVQVRFDAEVTSFRQDDAGVDVEVTAPDGRAQWHRASHLVAADGASSTVRQQLGIAFDGMTYGDRYLVLNTRFPFEEHLTDLARVNYVSDPEEYVVLLQAPAGWRVLFPVPDDLDPEVATDPEACQRRLQGVLATDEPYEIFHTKLYRIHQRVAERFRDGRVLLIGDAAHINSPIGGMGMNNGIHDAFALARVLPDVIGGRRPHGELDDWARRRREVAREYVRAITDRNSRALGERDEAARRQHQQELAATAADPERARAWLLRSSMLTAVRSQGLIPAPSGH